MNAGNIFAGQCAEVAGLTKHGLSMAACTGDMTTASGVLRTLKNIATRWPIALVGIVVKSLVRRRVLSLLTCYIAI